MISEALLRKKASNARVVSKEFLETVATKIIDTLKKQGDNVDKLGIEHNEVTAVLMNQVSQEGVTEGIRSTCKFYGIYDNEGGFASAEVIIGIGIGVIVLSYMISMAIGNFYTTDTTQWCKTDATGARVPDTMAQNLWWLIPAFVVIGALMLVIKNKR